MYLYITLYPPVSLCIFISPYILLYLYVSLNHPISPCISMYLYITLYPPVSLRIFISPYIPLYLNITLYLAIMHLCIPYLICAVSQYPYLPCNFKSLYPDTSLYPVIPVSPISINPCILVSLYPCIPYIPVSLNLHVSL